MNNKEIQDKVVAFLIDELEIAEDKIYGDASLKEDMGIDSLEIVDVIVYIEQEFGFKMKPEDFKAIKTLDEFCKNIEDRIAKQ